MWPDDGQEMWERDGYAEAMYEKADNDRKALKENGEANSTKSTEIRRGKSGASLCEFRPWTWLMSLLNRCDCGRGRWATFEDFVECECCGRSYDGRFDD